jgi:hypothetical protein
LKSLSDDPSLLFFVSVLFNAIVLHRVSIFFKAEPTFVFAIYFCIVYLIGQMTLIRQSIASSFILVAIACLCSDIKIYKSYFYILLGIFTHISTLIWLPFIKVIRFKPNFKIAVIVLVFGIVISFVVDDFVIGLLTIISNYTSGYFHQKMIEYIKIGQFEPSIASYFYIIANLLILRLVFIVGKKRNWEQEFIVYFHVTFLLLVTLIFFSKQPIFWNRISLVAVPLQAIFLFKYLNSLKNIFKFYLLALIYLSCFTILVYSLNKKNMGPFMPYQSILQRIVL